jgi:hypothetical protein
MPTLSSHRSTYAGRAALASLVVLLAPTVLTACGSNSSTASSGPTTTAPPAGVAQACAARDQLASAAQTVATDIQAHNFGAARDALTNASTAATDLKNALHQMQSEEAAKLEPQVDTLRTQLDQARNAGSLSAARTALTQAAATASSLTSTLTTDLHCPSS